MARKRTNNGFTLTELVMATAILGLLTSIAVPNYIAQLCRSESVEAESTIASLKAIISAYVDETGALPTNWSELNSISAIMSNNGQMSGSFSETMTLPNENYEIRVSGPANSTYNLTALRVDGCPNRDINACLDVSTGASDLTRGDGTTNAAVPNCS